jgi:hypothetical protein
MKWSSGTRKAAKLFDFCFLLFATSQLLCGVAGATPSITLSRKTGPPTISILVSGRGFAPNVGVDIYFDTKDEVLAERQQAGEDPVRRA